MEIPENRCSVACERYAPKFHRRYTNGLSPAGVVELVDAPDSKSGASDGVRVRVPPSAPINFGLTQCLADHQRFKTGAVKSKTAMAKIVPEIGRVTKVVKSPMLMTSA